MLPFSACMHYPEVKSSKRKPTGGALSSIIGCQRLRCVSSNSKGSNLVIGNACFRQKFVSSRRKFPNRVSWIRLKVCMSEELPCTRYDDYRRDLIVQRGVQVSLKIRTKRHAAEIDIGEEYDFWKHIRSHSMDYSIRSRFPPAGTWRSFSTNALGAFDEAPVPANPGRCATVTTIRGVSSADEREEPHRFARNGAQHEN